MGWKLGMEKLNAWYARGKRGTIPAMVQASRELLITVLTDWRQETNAVSYSSQGNLQVIRLGYAMAITRCVNLAVDDLQQGQFAQSILELGAQIGIPRWVINLRHESTHGNDLPSIQMLRLASDSLMLWLREYYWDVQAQTLVDTPQKIQKMKLVCAFHLEKIAVALKNIHFNEDAIENSFLDSIEDCIEGLLKDLGHTHFGLFVPGFVRLLLSTPASEEFCKSEKVSLVSTLREDLRWGPFLAAIDDRFQGMTWRILDILCEQVCMTKNDAHASSKHPCDEKTNSNASESLESDFRALQWIRYFLSRRWHSFVDESLALWGKSKTNLFQTVPAKWTSLQIKWMLTPASSHYQDCVLIKKWLRVAFINSHETAQRFISIALPVVTFDSCQDDALEIATELIRTRFRTDKHTCKDLEVSVDGLESFCDATLKEKPSESSSIWKQSCEWESRPIGYKFTGSDTEESKNLDTEKLIDCDITSVNANHTTNTNHNVHLLRWDVNMTSKVAKQARLLF